MLTTKNSFLQQKFISDFLNTDLLKRNVHHYNITGRTAKFQAISLISEINYRLE